MEADLLGPAHLDLSGSATLNDHRARRRNRLGRLGGRLQVEYARHSIGFHWAGCEERDEVDGEGTAKLLDDGGLEIEFECRSDEAVLEAKRDPSSTAY